MGRQVTLILLLAGQFALNLQAYAMAPCHLPDAPEHHAAAHTSSHSATHAEHSRAARSAFQEHHAQPSPTHECRCPAGMHCGLAAVMLMDDHPAMDRPAPSASYAPVPPLATALAHRRNPDRPPTTGH